MDETAEILFQYLSDVLYQPKKAVLDVESLPEGFQKLGKGLLFFAQMLEEVRVFARALGAGKLSTTSPSPENELAAPLKGLQAALRHLTWQSEQVADGDYSQRVDFMGDFSVAFNRMISQLDERQRTLVEEIKRGQEKARALERSNSFFEMLSEKTAQFIIVKDAKTGENLFLNAKARELLPQASGYALFWDWLGARTEELRALESEREMEAELVVGGERRAFSVSVYPIQWWQHAAVVYVIADVTKEKRRETELEWAANTDMLTGLYRRHYGMTVLHEWLKDDKVFCLCFIDLDNLKFVNDQYGHAEGDRYITDTAALIHAFGEGSIAVRLGGDELMVLADGWSEARAHERLLEIGQTLSLQGGPEYARSVSYGIVFVEAGEQRSQGELLALADERMYENKRERKRRGQKP